MRAIPFGYRCFWQAKRIGIRFPISWVVHRLSTARVYAAGACLWPSAWICHNWWTRTRSTFRCWKNLWRNKLQLLSWYAKGTFRLPLSKGFLKMPEVEARWKPHFFCCVAARVSPLRLRQFHARNSNKRPPLSNTLYSWQKCPSMIKLNM